jgi:hypothetical protein
MENYLIKLFRIFKSGISIYFVVKKAKQNVIKKYIKNPIILTL